MQSCTRAYWSDALRALDNESIKKLNFAKAIELEQACVRNLTPPEPGWTALSEAAAEISRYCANLLRSGFKPSRECEISARKHGHGVRPVVYWGPIERIIFRALAESVLSDLPRLDRSSDAYITFVKAPIVFAEELQQATTERASDSGGIKRLFWFFQSEIKYVVRSDINAFYQFIDHSILGQELLRNGAPFDLIQALMELLSEVQGRSFGLPQLLEASDALSEIYIDRVERQLIREGYSTWRFNDDFRIACYSYSEALAATEALDRAARSCGLSVNDSKTYTIQFPNYLLETIGKKQSEVGDSISPDEVEVLVGDYTDEYDEDNLDAAVDLINSSQESDNEDGINLRDLKSDDLRLLRRAFNALIAAKDPRVIDKVVSLTVYVPSLTPSLLRYLETVEPVAKDQVHSALGVLAGGTTAQNDWQRLWLVHTISQLSLLNSVDGELQSNLELAVTSTTEIHRNPALRSFAIRALARAGIWDFTQVLRAVELEPEAMLMTFGWALRESLERLEAAEREKLLKPVRAFSALSPVNKALVSSL